ncbi:L,D-transpeptidase [Scytonema sp. PRP1]|jgi:lipoprotein-anchoring transpeptidase ErfK/SrfK|uniref:L,D-transpeptidase n=1 Tax=Scytonema sp. PRP1 TaxID=3120513 RepID=UPI002FCE9CF9
MKLKQSVRLFFLIGAVGLCSSPQISLASEQTFDSNNSFNNSVTVPTNYYLDDLQNQPTYDDLQNQPTYLKISLSRRQVTLYRGKTEIKSYPIAVGRRGWQTPIGNFRVREMLENPTWIHPLKKGIAIPGGDPENPLGRYWIGFWTNGKNWIGFHGTPNPESVGKAVSHGCIRMYNKDVEELFSQVRIGTPVTVVQ